MSNRVVTAALLAALAASPAFAYVPPGEINFRGASTSPLGPQIRHVIPRPIRDVEEPAHPVPEPGTIAMASMGLMALGAHLRRRRGK